VKVQNGPERGLTRKCLPQFQAFVYKYSRMHNMTECKRHGHSQRYWCTVGTIDSNYFWGFCDDPKCPKSDLV
jgi:hypothetical protein